MMIVLNSMTHLITNKNGQLKKFNEKPTKKRKFFLLITYCLFLIL